MEKVLTEALTFDDVLVLPMHSDILPKEVSLKSKLTKNISLNLPFAQLLWIQLLNLKWQLH